MAVEFRKLKAIDKRYNLTFDGKWCYFCYKVNCEMVQLTQELVSFLTGVIDTVNNISINTFLHVTKSSFFLQLKDLSTNESLCGTCWKSAMKIKVISIFTTSIKILYN